MTIEKLIEDFVKEVMGKKYWAYLFPLTEDMTPEQYTKWLKNIYWALPVCRKDITDRLTKLTL